MAKRGRPPEPPKLRLLKGKAAQPGAAKSSTKGRKPRVPPAPALEEGDRAVAPAELPAEEARCFEELVRRLEDAKIPSARHTRLIAIAAKRQVEISDMDVLIVQHGAVYRKAVLDDEGNDTGEFLLKPNPAVRMRSDAMRHLHSLLAEMGLTPAATNRVGSAGAPAGAAKNSRFAKFKGAGG